VSFGAWSATQPRKICGLLYVQEVAIAPLRALLMSEETRSQVRGRTKLPLHPLFTLADCCNFFIRATAQFQEPTRACLLQQTGHRAFARELCAIGISTADVGITWRGAYTDKYNSDALQRNSSNVSCRTRQSSMLKPEWQRPQNTTPEIGVH